MECPTITITFGDQAENHVGMQKIGQLADSGFSLEDLSQAHKYFTDKGYVCELINLGDGLPSDVSGEEAYVLIVRNGCSHWVNPDDFIAEQLMLDWDTKAKMRGRVVNKRARYNLCYAHTSQDPDYLQGKGRIISFSDVPLLSTIRNGLSTVLGKKAAYLMAEGNLYYDPAKCYIGYHGDSERRKVIAVRLGSSMPLYYQWYFQTKSIGKRMKFILHHGDLYIMSSKAVGFDWKKRSITTLRHAAGTKNE